MLKHFLLRHTRGVRTLLTQLMAAITTLSLSALAWADGGIIPISTDDQTASGSDFAQTLVHIFQKGLIPVVMLGGSVWVLWTGISTMANGVKEAGDRQKFDPLKNAIIKTVIVVVVGGALLYLLNELRTFKFS